MTRYPLQIVRACSITMVPRLLKASVLAVSLLAGGTAGAAPTVLYAGGFAVGIEDLVVDGANYDVAFAFGSFDTVFASQAPTFVGNSTGAAHAADALLAALDAEAVARLGGNPLTTAGSLFVAMDDTRPGSVTATSTGYRDNGVSWLRYANHVLDRTADRTSGNLGFAVFTADPQNTVPEPTALALVGTGLAALGLARRRRA